MKCSPGSIQSFQALLIKPGTLTLALLAALLLLMAGCAALSVENEVYSLTDPRPPMVLHRVHKKDQLTLDLSDGSTVKLEVEAVDSDSIRGKGGVATPINMIQELHCTTTSTVGDALIGSVVLTGMFIVGVWALPVLIPIALLEDNEALDNWPEEALCRTFRHPGQYGYSEAGIHTTIEDAHTVAEIGAEIERRKLECDEAYRAEKRCAFMYSSGPVFADCAAIVTDMERLGMVPVTEWSIGALCEVSQNPAFLEALALWPAGEQTEQLVTAARQEIQGREIECPRPLGPPGYVPLFR
jgi:hypothetical protein